MPCVRSRGVASTCAARIDPITTTNRSLQPAELSWCVRVAPDKRENHRTTFLRCHRVCEALLDSSRIFCSVSGLVVLALAACFPAEVVGKEDGTTWWWCSSSRRIATGLIIAAGVECTSNHVASQRSPAPASWLLAIGQLRTGASPPAGSVGHRLGEGSQPPAFSCGLLLLGAALTLLVVIGGLSRVAGVTATSVKCLQVYANVHVMFNSLVASTLKSACMCAHTRADTHKHARTLTHAYAHARTRTHARTTRTHALASLGSRARAWACACERVCASTTERSTQASAHTHMRKRKRARSNENARAPIFASSEETTGRPAAA